MQVLHDLEGKEIKSVNSDDIVDEADKKNAEKQTKKNQKLLDFVKESLEGVKEVRISEKLKSHPVCLSSEGPVTLEMEKYFAQMNTPGEQAMKADRVLELNASHPMFEALSEAFASDQERAKKLSKVLYSLKAGRPGGHHRHGRGRISGRAPPHHRHDRYARLPGQQRGLQRVRPAHRRGLPVLRPGGPEAGHLRQPGQDCPH